MPKEIWKPVTLEDFPGYEVSNLGRVRRDGHIRKAGKTNTGYSLVLLYNHCRHKHVLVHRLVAMAFIPNGDDSMDVNHKDGDKDNNRADNLEWCTRAENIKHAYATGLRSMTNKQLEALREIGRNTKNLVYQKPKTIVCMDMEGRELRRFDSVDAVFQFLQVTKSGVIAACCSGRKKSYKGYTWKYGDV